MRLLLLFLVGVFLGTAAMAQKIKTIILDTPSELIRVKIMVRAGSAYDPPGQEGLASMSARLLLEGSYGDPAKPVTKEELADLVRPWGSGAKPSVRVEKETATFSMEVPRETFGEFAERVLKPMFSQPRFATEELDRIRKETKTVIGSTLRLENTELLGLYALDGVLHRNTGYAHVPIGTIQGLDAITRESVLRFYKTYYAPQNAVVALSTKDEAIVKLVEVSLREMGKEDNARPLAKARINPPKPHQGRSVLIVSQPATIATGIHAGFPISITRSQKDYWALYVANVHFGTHRDGFGILYDQIRQARGYNYGDYSYIEWFEGRPFYLFPPPNVPRRYQCFSIWVRPVQHEYAHHLMKAITWELEKFVRDGMTPEQCALAKNKAKVLYLNLAETSDRLLASKLDDDFYGIRPGYLDQYLENIENLTPADINAAIKKYLQWKDMSFVVVTNEEWAQRLKTDIAENRNAKGKDFSSYQVDTVRVAEEPVWQFPQTKIELVQKDKVWESVWLDIPAERIKVVKSTELFEKSDF
ncbi:MAG: insulinase family protein [Ignavibacteriales bacterium]|nr:insulinase family protein [Ignavibacteriales bacterium]